MILEIKVTQEELLQAAKNLIYLQSLDKDTEANQEAIANIIKQHLEYEIEERISNPEKYLKPEEWEQISNCFIMSPTAYQRMMNQDIPNPALS